MRISIVVLNYGLPDLTLECLQSIEQTEQRSNVEIVLVDNGSDLSERLRLLDGVKTRAIRVEHFVQLPGNVGFSLGMNAGISLATGEIVIALNSDTMVGRRLPGLLLRQNVDAAERIGFFAVPVFDAELSAAGMGRTDRLQGNVTALTWYVSCMPVRSDAVCPRYVLGPPGPAVVMTREFIAAMTAGYGFVYDPNFFLYGEDVDLFLRARRDGFRTCVLEGSVEREDVIWHVGSAVSSATGVRTLDKSPEVAGRVLSGCLRNALRHAGLVELAPILLLQLWFRILFFALYAQRHSGRLLPRLILAAGSSNLQDWRSRREHDRTGAGAFLLPLVALLYRQPLPWARRRGGLPQEIESVYERT